MHRSLTIKALMLAGTVGLVLWIGWPVSDDPWLDRRKIRNAPNRPVVTADGETRLSSVMESGGSPTSSPFKTWDGSSNRLLNLNRATKADLEHLPGVGPTLAARIIQYREGRGDFRHVADLLAVKGIGPKRYDQIRNLVGVGSAADPPTNRPRVSGMKQAATQGTQS